MALIPQTAGTASFSINIAPMTSSPGALSSFAEGVLLEVSLLKFISPNRSVNEVGLVLFVFVVSRFGRDIEFERTL